MARPRRRTDGDEPQKRQDPYVERLRPDPSEPAPRVARLAGLLGDSDREGFRRLYFTRELDYHADVPVEDILDVETIPADQPPFVGLEATRLTVRREATLQFTRTAHAPDEWDLDIAIGYKRFIPSRWVRTAAGGCLEALSVDPACYTMDTCVTCGPECRITYNTCAPGICAGGGDWVTDDDPSCVTCGGGECPDTLSDACRTDYYRWWRRHFR